MSTSLFVSTIIAAGGRGERFGGARPKQLLEIGGRTVLDRSIYAFASHDRVAQIVVALPADLAAAPDRYVANTGKPTTVVAGGARRQDSVANGFAAVDPRTDVVLIHDAARPFVSAALIDRVIDAASSFGAAIAAVPARDTVKQVIASLAGSDPGLPVIGATLPRESIYLAQTPQAFRYAVLADAVALGRAGGTHTDEAALAEAAGHPVRIVEGEATNMKITTPDDLRVAELVASQQARPARTGRAGTGYDLHRLVAGRPLVVGGITIPFERGPLGHSDGDVVCHAATDAILGAAGLGDIGRHFSDTDPRWKGASSLELLARAVAMIAQEGLEVGNIDVTVVLEAPKIREHIDAMRAAVARAIGIDPSRVSIKGKTNEGLDAIGRGEAIAAHAVALLRRR